ncbi:aminotransferase class I/II-fold pyridoxal phosphate-dependent enzyme [Ferroplasma acidiphilum]|jgi:histidinol-phosphate/aromatic aminotransferase/cobyric acid decarboxylase-like protein|uniref:aminotransferase class I/II-fold pyridoxal phosphate-dependent enzyme n=1 Tax=Ferroplasma acidiphilum TaxID=74969 RepID=UPI0023F079E9|nr:aminotransferase class I/II-fold pyridoxal phosphate-dependent enzyme [Ferroplasma acidiphilum]MCL4349262.1 aminotransferase class I/II-fold pyridoxal phosphate-dependent enzyme [Candidatus Thermoplasmatota archaeon]
MHGGNIYDFARENQASLSSILDFSASISDFNRVKNFIIKKEYIENYPETNLAAYKKILAGNEFNPANISLVSGLTAFIHTFLASIKGNVIIISPAFTEYLKPQIEGKRIIIPFNVVNDHPEILSNFNFEALFLVYPDSPTGQLMSSSSIYSIIEIAMKKNSTVFLDESFIWFVNNREIMERELIEKYNNVIIGRSMTKILSIPGLRLGYIASNSTTIHSIEEKLEPWRINQAALAYIYGHVQDLSNVALSTETERNYLIKSLKNIGFRTVGKPRANYITFQLPASIDGSRLKAYLAGKNIMIRLLDDYNEFGSNYMRISVKKRVKNKVLINALNCYTGEIHG